MPPAHTIGAVADAQLPNTISVVAAGEATVAPDLALVSLTVSASGKELAPLRDDVNRRASAVLAWLRGLGIAEADLNAPDLTIQPDYDARKGRMAGYRVARAMTVRVRELERLGAVLDGVIGAGANELYGTQMSAAEPSAAEHAALSAAVAAARAKAAALAAAADVKLRRVVRIEEEPSYDEPVPMLRLAGAESADVPTQVVAGELKVSRRVRVWFEIG
jgi:uncharacterized protein